MKKEVILKTALNKSHALSQGLQKRKEKKIGQKIIEKVKTKKMVHWTVFSQKSGTSKY